MNADSRDTPGDTSNSRKSGTTLIERTIRLADNRLDSRDLFADAREILIAHGEETYRLRLTSQNKLILTK